MVKDVKNVFYIKECKEIYCNINVNIELKLFLVDCKGISLARIIEYYKLLSS